MRFQSKPCLRFSGLLFFVFTIQNANCVWPSLPATEPSGLEKPQLVMELGIVCDYKFSELFNFNESKITEIMVDEVRNMDITYQTLILTKISFVITSIQVIKSTKEQPFIEQSRQKDGIVDIVQVRDSFSKWVYQSAIANVSDAVVLVTGENRISWEFFGFDAAACKVDHVKGESQNVVVVECSRDNYFYHTKLSIPIAELYVADMQSINDV